MVFIFVSFFWLYGLFLVTMAVFIPMLFLVYRLTGGKMGFIRWFKAMRF